MLTANSISLAMRLAIILTFALGLVLVAVTSHGVLRAAGPTFTVDSTADGADSNPGDGFCDDGSGKCTLRAAIEESNASSTTSTIAFNIPTTDPGYQATTTSFRISPTSSLPTITSPVVIDGYTQLGSAVNSDLEGFNGVLKIELDGSLAGTSTDGLKITGGTSTVRGLVINRFDGEGIALSANGGNLIKGNFVGTDVTGTVDFGNTINGIGIIGGSGNRIGGLSPEDRNVISGNGQFGVEIFASSMNLVAGNLIGTDASGATGVGNSLGVAIRSFSTTSSVGWRPERAT